jgi:nicotinamidase-related amidase
MSEKEPALLLIDVQQGFDDSSWGVRNNPGAEGRMAALLGAWRSAGLPVLHVQHMSSDPASPLHPDAPGNAFQAAVAPRPVEPVFQKTVNSAFIGTDLESFLRDAGIRSLVVVGLTTDHCVSTTIRMASNLEFDVVVVDDATATFGRTGPDGTEYSAEEVHRLALVSLHGEFARVRSSRDVLAGLRRGDVV